MPEYSVSLTIMTSATDPAQAAQDFVTYVESKDRSFTLVVSEFDADSILRDVALVEVSPE